ncbi:zonular occludens toxin, partial [Vibrio cholerae]|nr:zonular occludens toxin [Vibrio cholerae]MVD25637.1 zonular occludens toxin [Vibrio cholerae]MVF10511.1 zonular occludens toxin [Vibrio cholerae]
MSIFIHHGAPGSYKTSGALWLRLLPAIKSGRHIITNVRGLNLERM